MSATELIDGMIAKLLELPADVRQKQIETFMAGSTMPWVPNPGPQTTAYKCDVDELLYGGEAGGGKSDILIGKALNRHQRSLLLRRVAAEVPYLIERTENIVGHRNGFNGQHKRWHINGRTIAYGGCQHAGDERGYKGERKDFIGIDEGSEFLESQVEFLIGWLGSIDPNQKCQLCIATNPPMLAEGMWIIEWWAPWLDKNHPLYPWPDGQPLWCMRRGSRWEWYKEPHSETAANGATVNAKSRTFIRSGLRDNPDLARTGYGSQLANMREDLRRAYAEGDFSAGMGDQERQVIPTEWIRAAQDRWRADAFQGEQMTAMGFDPAGGGRDSAELAYRYGGWYSALVSKVGVDTRDGMIQAGMIVGARRGDCPIVIDVGGGYAGAVIERLRDNSIPFRAFNGTAPSMAKTKDGKLRFANKRAEAWWKFSEELDPSQEGGSTVALPPDAELRGDLAAPTYTVGAKGILLESKDDIRKRLGRSPGKGDAVVMAMSEGNKALAARADRTGISADEMGYAPRTWNGRPNVILGHQAARRVSR